MRIVGLFIVIFSVVAIDKFLGFSDMAMVVGLVVASSSYVLLNTGE